MIIITYLIIIPEKPPDAEGCGGYSTNDDHPNDGHDHPGL